jgi:hypothetical protein
MQEQELTTAQDTVQGPGPYGPLHLGRGTFGQAIEALKGGLKVSRAGWNGKGMFIFMRPSDAISQSNIQHIKSLPQSVKDYFNSHVVDGEFVLFTAYLCMKAADGTIVNGWLASQTDMLAEDWGLVE